MIDDRVYSMVASVALQRMKYVFQISMPCSNKSLPRYDRGAKGLDPSRAIISNTSIIDLRGIAGLQTQLSIYR